MTAMYKTAVQTLQNVHSNTGTHLSTLKYSGIHAYEACIRYCACAQGGIVTDGDVIANCCADDWWDPNSRGRRPHRCAILQIAVIANCDVAFVTCDDKLLDCQYT